MTPKTTDQYIGFSTNRYDSVYTVDLTSVVSNYKSLLIITTE